MITSSEQKTSLSWALQQTTSLRNQEPEFELKEAETKHPRANT
jgi:hypothetical protein